MENNIRFRNHISIIFEKAIRGIGTIVFIFVGSFLADIGEMEESRIGFEVLILLGILLGCLALLIGWQAIVWAKTYITIQENTIVVERNTLNRKKNTIGIKNISNVNLEQNLLEMVLGTCTVKLDTNSLSTADQTDLAIVLKKKDAEAFRQMIFGKINGEETGVMSDKKQEAKQRQYISNLDDVAIHGLFSINLLSVVILIGAIILIVIIFGEMINDPEVGVVEAIMSLLVAVWCVAGWAWNIMKNFVKYADFKIERNADKIFLNYGVLKKVAYSIPVDKINAVRLNQTWIARIAKYYTVEVINVGMDDDEEEVTSFFLPYNKKEKLKQLFNMLLPEFSECLDIEEEKQPKSIWVLWIPVVVIYSLIMSAAFGIGMELAQTYMEDSDGFEWILLGGIAILSFLFLVRKIASYLTEGCKVQEHFLKIVSGAFFKQSLFVKYEKIQYVQTKQNMLAKHYDIEKGDIHILASMKNQTHLLPYCREEVMEELRKKILF